MNLDLAQFSLDVTVPVIHVLDQEVLTRQADFIAGMDDGQTTSWAMGNGGSASTGSHMAGYVGKGIRGSLQAPIRALSLNEQASTQSALVNDFDLDEAMPDQRE